jgi:hypothetical protein
LVLLHREQIIAPAGHDLLAHLPLGLQRVPHHHVPRQLDLGERGLRGWEFRSLFRGADLGEHRSRAQGVDRDQMDPRDLFPVDAAQGLAVHGQRFVRGDAGACEPRSQRRLEGGDVEASEDAVQRRHTGSSAGLEAQIQEQGGIILAAFGAPLGDGIETAAAAEHGGHRHLEKGDEVVDAPMGAARVGEWGQGLCQGAWCGWVRVHGDLLGGALRRRRGYLPLCFPTSSGNEKTLCPRQGLFITQ